MSNDKVTNAMAETIKKMKSFGIRTPTTAEFMKSFNDLPTLEERRSRYSQMKLTVIVKDRFGGLVPQVIMIDGATPVHKIGQAIVEAVRIQTVNDGTGIVKATIGPDEIYNAE